MQAARPVQKHATDVLCICFGKACIHVVLCALDGFMVAANLTLRLLAGGKTGNCPLLIVYCCISLLFALSTGGLLKSPSFSLLTKTRC